jgi:hypothetical protein
VASGLVKIRRCAWQGGNEEVPARPVFVRGGAVAFRCPKSIVTAQSLGFIELFAYWKRGGGDLWPLDAKSADALLALQEESVKESKNEEH